jgi:hypothetical protein
MRLTSICFGIVTSVFTVWRSQLRRSIFHDHIVTKMCGIAEEQFFTPLGSMVSESDFRNPPCSFFTEKLEDVDAKMSSAKS